MTFRHAYLLRFNEGREGHKYTAGQAVFLHAPAMALRWASTKGKPNSKFIRPWVPATIVAAYKNNNVLVKLERNSKNFRVHVDRVKPRHGQPDLESLPTKPLETKAQETPPCESEDSSEEESASEEEPDDSQQTAEKPTANPSSDAPTLPPPQPPSPDISEQVQESLATPEAVDTEDPAQGSTPFERARRWTQQAGRALRSGGPLAPIPAAAKAAIGRKTRKDKGQSRKQ